MIGMMMIVIALPTTYNPFTGKLDYYGLQNQTCPAGQEVRGFNESLIMCETIYNINITTQSNLSKTNVYGGFAVMNNSVTKLNLTWFGRGCMYDNGTAVIGEYPCTK